MTKPSVLIVDDQELFREAMETEFEFFGYEITLAEDGLAALEICKSKQFDLIVSDMRMPRCDGKQFLVEFRKLYLTHPPFLIMTGFTDMRVSEAFELGADAFLGKPLNLEYLEEVVTKLQIPIERRWTGECDLNSRLVIRKKFDKWDDAERKRHLKMGRIGFSITDFSQIDLLLPKAKIAFEFQFNEGPFPVLAGCGKVAWIDSSGSQSQQAVVGIEIENLEGSCRSQVIQFLNQKKFVESIPAYLE